MARPSETLINRALTAGGAVRDLVNFRRRHRKLMKEPSRYNTIRSAMDVLSDTTQALAAYATLGPAGDKGHAYLVVYGVLQTLYLQQDAGFWLLKLLGIAPTASFKSPGRWAITVPAIDAARSARNNSVGHPVRRDRSGPLASFFIVQSSLGADGFRLLESDEHGTGRFSSVSTARLATEQLESICELLEDASRQLVAADRKHHRRFMNDRLQTLFERARYPVSKLGAAPPDERAMQTHDAALIRKALTQFREAMLTREEPFEEDLEWSYRKIERALKIIDDYAGGVIAVDDTLADVCSGFVHYEIEHLRDYAASIDDNYSEDEPQADNAGNSKKVIGIVGDG